MARQQGRHEWMEFDDAEEERQADLMERAFGIERQRLARREKRRTGTPKFRPQDD